MALLGSAIFTFWISKKFAKPVAAAPKQQYVASTQNLNAGETLQKANLQLVDWPGSKPLDGAFQKPDDLVGRVVLYPLGAGEPIQERHLAAPGSGLGLSSHIPDGMRAISLKSDQVVGVAGFLLPGTHVDVLVTYRNPNSPDPVTATVLQDAQVIAAGQNMAPDPQGKITPVDVLTLLVTPEDAERVTLASAQGSVHFVLRNSSDHAHTDDQAAEVSGLSGATPAKPVAPMSGTPQKMKVVAPPPIQTYTVVTTAGDKQKTEIFQ